MKIRSFLYTVILGLAVTGCNSNNALYDAEGTFEVDEVIVSSEVPGKIISLNVEEGSLLKKGSVVGVIDSIPLNLQKAQVEATMAALHQKTMDVRPQVKMLKDQIAVQKVQLANAIHEKNRTERLLKADAATGKQLDDWNNAIDVLQKQITVNEQQIKVQETATAVQNSSVLSEFKPLKKSVAQINDQLKRTNIINPINGTVLIKYAMAGEMTAIGKPVYKIGDLSVITLRAYITETQLAQIKLNQQVKVLVDSSPTSYRTYTGTIIWISDKAEFTPKTIQTKEERANLVYAVKIHVKNDGYLKIGMYGNVKF
ncbi:HlyD family efflux transporter periplasmic adaptor subunit [Chryseobacterium gotjawalense]|uniref:HlyD family efflux transporter periplasmic adaptor subunit n=1 Tax=Chryseobacterium gotjawalense TaxID=3042315 RepID=A0ABY8RHM1_9FLAO|nr:HlyD family efflux transporter periplasmic adaptor subunit [Chryseobacterium sp. wdc7]WHF52788.1 HlyD family efflux transporter periplasmic adaptor subunit [Chryseobacterium sp. wdc7]